MKILFVLENYYPNVGGVETLFKNLIEQLSEAHHEVILITTQLHSDLPKVEKQDRISIYRYPFRNRYIFTFFAFFPILRHAGKCDLVHTTSYNAGLPAFFGGKLRGKKVIITFHEAWGKLWFRLPFMSSPGRWLHYLFEQFLLKLPFDRFVGVSKNTAQRLKEEGVRPDRVVVNYNGIDYDSLPNRMEDIPKNDLFTYTFYGRLGISKGLDLIMDAAKVIKDKYPNTRLQLIVPKTPEGFFKTIMDIIETNELTSYIKLQHSLPYEKLFEELYASDAVLIPSYSEGFCFAAAECVAKGIPIISSDQAALKEVVSGTFIKMEDFSVDGLITAIEKAIKGEWQQSPIQKFELQANTDRYITLYKKLLSY